MLRGPAGAYDGPVREIVEGVGPTFAGDAMTTAVKDRPTTFTFTLDPTALDLDMGRAIGQRIYRLASHRAYGSGRRPTRRIRLASRHAVDVARPPASPILRES